MFRIGDIKCAEDLPVGEYAYSEHYQRYYVKRLSNGDKCGVVSRMFSRDGNLYVDTYGGTTFRVTGDDLGYQLCVERC
jgi:hypothetical protein